MAASVDVQRCAADGWTIAPGVFDQATMSALAATAKTCCDAELRGEDVRILRVRGEKELSAELSADMRASLVESDGESSRKLDAPFRKHADFQRVATAPALTALATELLGGDADAVLLTDQLFMKPPRVGSAKPYHQDNWYALLVLVLVLVLVALLVLLVLLLLLARLRKRLVLVPPLMLCRRYFGVKDSSAVLTAWIALEDADEGNGCLAYIDGSHTAGLVEHVCTDPASPFNMDAPAEEVVARGGSAAWPPTGRKERLAEVKQGGVVFHHGATLHSSGPNPSTRWRRGYAVVFGRGGEGAIEFDRDSGAENARPMASGAYCRQSWYDEVISRVLIERIESW